MNTDNNQNKKRIKDLVIFYTPQVVVDFIFDILEIWKKEQINRWKIPEGKQKYPSVIDPAVGEGIFLKTAISKNFTKPEWIFGLDIDESAVTKWKEINLLKEFGGVDEDLEAHFFHQNGLEKIKWDQHKSKYRYKLRQIDIENQQFDAVVGNPPYGGIGLGQGKLTDELVERLTDFEIFPNSVKKVLNNANVQPDFFNSDKSFFLSCEVKQKIKSFPIEILFLERFIQLAKPNGWIAVIIPDGILTNSNSDYVREFISKRTKVEAVISLPRNTFKDAGTNAKTSILFLRKLQESEISGREYNIFLSSKTIKEIEGKNCVISGDHVRKSRGESKGYNLGTGIEYYETMGFLSVAYDYLKVKECSQNAFDRLKTTKVMKNDILISCAGVGGVGKAKKSIITNIPKEKSCTGDVFILRLNKINPYYCYIFLNSVFGESQIIRQQAGTGTVNINTEQTLSILIPELNIQSLIESVYKDILQYFDLALKAKQKNDKTICEENLKIAEKKLKKLIIDTEAVIRGEKETIN